MKKAVLVKRTFDGIECFNFIDFELNLSFFFSDEPSALRFIYSNGYFTTGESLQEVEFSKPFES